MPTNQQIPFIDYFQNLFKESLKNPPLIYNWSEQSEGLHRTLFKLKSLEKIPPIVIYFAITALTAKWPSDSFYSMTT